MNKIEIAKGLYRQNIYNINIGDGHYTHLTCYFNRSKDVLMVFKAGENLGMVHFEENKDLIPLQFSEEIVNTIREVLNSWTYDHIEAVGLYNPDCFYNTSCKGIFEITARDNFIINTLAENKEN